MKSVSFLLIFVLSTILGCSQSYPAKSGSGAANMAQKGRAEDANVPGGPAQKKDAKDEQAVNLEADAPDKKRTQRRIKYTAKINLIADDFSKSEKQLVNLVEKYEGLLAHSDVKVAPGSPRTGTWTVRIPVEKFHIFCEEAQQIAELQSQTRDSEDVTMEYTDLQVYIENRKKEIEGLGKIRDKASLEKDMKYLLEVCREIKSVENELYKNMGRLKVLTDLTDLTTITITIHERQKYDHDKPPPSVERPSFDVRAAKTFNDSIESLRSFGAETAIFIILISPWVALIVVVALPIWLVELLRQKRKAAAAAKVAADKAHLPPSPPEA